MSNINSYIYVKKAACTQIGNNFKINFNTNLDRPFNTISIVAASIELVDETGMVCIRSDLQPLNGYSLDFYNTCLAMFDYNTQLTAGHHSYSMVGYEQAEYVVQNNLQTFQIGIFNESATQVAAGDVLNFSIMFKVSYFNENTPIVDYRKQVPL